MANFLLSRRAFVSVAQGQAVVLDLENDKYFTLTDDSVHTLAGHIEGWSSLLDNADSAGGADKEPQLLDDLLKRGLITDDPHRGKSVHPLRIAVPIASLAPDAWDTNVKVAPSHIIRFLTATIVASLLLRILPLRTLIALQTRRASRSPRSSTIDIERTRFLIAAFSQLRPLAFSRKDQCLFDSLALLRFLALYGVDATWVFGVRSAPFGAHCWLQVDDVLLNDSIYNVGNYVPIMTV